MKLLLATLVSSLLLVSGCASKGHAVFVTKTSLSIVDVDTAPSGVSFGYQRAEGYVGPSLENGHVVPVVGYLRSDGTLLSRALAQVYATGCAAETVVEDTGWVAPSSSSCNRAGPVRGKKEKNVVIFATGTNLGLAFHFAEGSPPSMNLGYRRKEASFLPVEAGAIPSVIAMHEHGASVQIKDNKAEGGANVTQFFATGLAADALARNEKIRSGFHTGARDAFQAYFEHDHRQNEHALLTLSCLSRLSDSDLVDVKQSLHDLDFPWYSQLESIEVTAPADAAQFRRRYTQQIALSDPEDQELTLRLGVHRRFVCARADSTARAPQ